MMRFDVITIFPESFSYLNESILKRAQQKGLIKIRIHNLRDFTADKHKKVDDKPYGGGPGMVIKIEPIIKAVQFLTKKLKYSKTKSLIILFSPAGKQFDNKIAVNLARNYEHLILICGHYEGIDERLSRILKAKSYKLKAISIGPYTLTGGELPAMILIDAVCRRLAGVLGKEESLEEKRLGLGVPVYTRPEVFVWPPPGRAAALPKRALAPRRRGKKKKEYRVPKILLSGNHLKITQWRVKHRK